MVSVSLPFHLVYEGFVDKRIGIVGIECDAGPQKGLHIINKVSSRHLLLHVVYELFVGRSLAYYEFHILLVALQDFLDIYFFSLQGYI